GDDIEEELGRADCIGMQPVGNLRYPLSQLPLIVSFKTGPPVCVILKEGQIEWVVQLGKDQRWSVALASDNERYLGIISYRYRDNFPKYLFLVDCEQKTISPPLEFDFPRLRKYRSYDLSGVTDDGQLILCDRDIVLARYKERWELERVKVLDPPVEQILE
ncbi:MAG TPA: hypothetical protein VLA12_07695, partial [Planctomycetaceae bacterium]|nr:hypothetical protein [Planctomycetaceae bacterium]